jgi:multisubunit Na+/H+ antiporter MnhB subunit
MRLLFDFISLCLLALGLILFVLSLIPAVQKRFRPIFSLTLWAVGLGLAVFIAGLLFFKPARLPPSPPLVPQEGAPTV